MNPESDPCNWRWPVCAVACLRSPPGARGDVRDHPRPCSREPAVSSTSTECRRAGRRDCARTRRGHLANPGEGSPVTHTDAELTPTAAGEPRTLCWPSDAGSGARPRHKTLDECRRCDSDSLFCGKLPNPLWLRFFRKPRKGAGAYYSVLLRRALAVKLGEGWKVAGHQSVQHADIKRKRALDQRRAPQYRCDDGGGVAPRGRREGSRRR
jgi:hypothetical protein